MAEIKKKLNIKKVTIKNILLLILALLLMVVVNAIGRVSGMGNNGNSQKIDIVQAQSCWVPSTTGCDVGCDVGCGCGGSSAGSSGSSGGGSSSSCGC